jgi:recombination protein RecR
MSAYPRSLEQLLDALQRLPGVGRKTAERLAFHLLRADRSEVLELARAISAVKEHVSYCTNCFNLAESSPCPACGPERDQRTICVVEEPKDIIALENTGRYRGTYHVLLGRVAPLEGHDASSLTTEALDRRLSQRTVEEVIIATQPDLEGDTTALHVARIAARHGVRITRLARGLPTGINLEHASAAILGDALTARRTLNPGTDD